MAKLYLIPDSQNLIQSISLAKSYDAAFEYNDFFMPAVLDNREWTEYLISQYLQAKRDRSKDTLHGVFLDIAVFSKDSQIKKASEYRVRQCLSIAQRLGCCAVIFHTNYMPNFMDQNYREEWVNNNFAFWNEMLCNYKSLCIYIENMFDREPHLLAQLAKAMKQEPRFGVCLDYAHANISGTPLKIWTEYLLPYTRHIHINDNNGCQDSHNPVGTDSIDWNIYNELMKPAVDDLGILIEVKSLEGQQKSLSYMSEYHIYPL